MISIWQSDNDDKNATLKNIESSSSLASADLTITAPPAESKKSKDAIPSTMLDVPKVSGSRSKSPESSSSSLRCRRVAEVSESIEEDSSSAISSNDSPLGLVVKREPTSPIPEPTSTTNLDVRGVDGEPKCDADKQLATGVYKLLNYEIPTRVHIGYLLLALIVIFLLSATFMIYQIYSRDRGGGLDAGSAQLVCFTLPPSNSDRLNSISFVFWQRDLLKHSSADERGELILKWQKEMQEKSIADTKNIITSQLDHLDKVRIFLILA